MKIQILGCHHTETAKTRLASFLVDRGMALDAGAITSSLTAEEQAQIQAVLITHQHLDHVRDLPMLALGGFESGTTLSVFALPETLAAIKSHLLNGALYPDFTQIPSPQNPRVRLLPLEPWQEREVCGLKVTPIPVDQGVPAVGYHIASPGGRSFFYTGDTNGDGLADICKEVRPDLVMLEVTFSNSREDLARQVYHMTPRILERELQKLLELQNTLPQIIVVHMNPQVEGEIVAELRLLADKLGASITPAHEGMEVEV